MSRCVRQAGLLNDAELITGCLAGSEHAWSILVGRYSGLIYSIALRSGLEFCDAEEVVQNVLIAVLRNLESLENPDRLSSWLIAISHREAWRMKSARKRDSRNELSELSDTAPGLDEQIVEWERAFLLRQAIESISPQCQRIVRLLFLSGRTADYRSVSEQTGLAIGSIGPMRARCLNQLRDSLEDAGFLDTSL